MSDKINIILNGKHTTGIKGESILEFARRQNIDIPTLCNDDRLEPYSSCYVCVVEVELNGRKGMQPSCSTTIAEGMVINTDNDAVRKSRKTALDLLVSNHYADCVGPCKETCPAGVDVQGYISLIEKGMYSEAIGLIKEANPLPAICGRVCVRPCEDACRRNHLDEGAAVGIDYLKRFAADEDFANDNHYKPEVQPSTGKKVAIIGAGPGGLSAAWFLQIQGHQCDIYEASNHPGGWLRYGIPEYRLPNDVLDKEVSRITDLGVNIHYNQKLGDNLSYKELKDKYDATILTIGSQRGTLLRAEGEDAENVFSGIDFLRNMEMTGQRYDFTGKKVAVVGGGNTAMDCCRTSIRCGSTNVKVIYRRTEKEMPANPIEIHESKLEGVQYDLLTNPVRVNKDDKGRVKSMTLIKMELGEPDESGRRRPQPVEGSEYEEEFDYILAAIGQKTEINFLDDINSNTSGGELKPNRWGDIDADPKTLQTGIPSVFAAGDGVTGPATIIEAVAQAKMAAHSCHLFITGQDVTPLPKEFISRKDNFKKLENTDFTGRYQSQLREEMPTLAEDLRVNFNEVELGYKNEDVAQKEAARCLECGCSEFYTCDLKKHATEYQAEQKNYLGSFKEADVDFSHPFIEIDNNKCVLCSRCIRICKEVVGANALGLVNRGFDTYVAPSMGKSLLDTNCESCGLCISACPTGAITENVLFKPAPIKTDEGGTICNYCSIGCSIKVHHKSDFVTGVTGSKGTVNALGNLCKYPKFGYHYLNDKKRITTPLIKDNGGFREATYQEAFEMIKQEAAKTPADENLVFAGARLSNEELFTLQKFARQALKTNNVGSFHYLGREYGHAVNAVNNASMNELSGCNKIYLLGAEVNKDNAVAGFMIQNASHKNHIPVTNITTLAKSSMSYKTNDDIKVDSYYHLVMAMNYYFVSNGLQNQMFINDRCGGFDAYKTELLNENYSDLINQSGIGSEEDLKKLADEFNNTMNVVLVFSEKEVDEATSVEIHNLALITGKLGKTSSGVLALKEKSNSQGLFDMGVAPGLKIGGQVSDSPTGMLEVLYGKQYRNLFVFGEDPVGTAKDVALVGEWFDNAGFVVVQDAFMTETTAKADVILPAAFSVECDGSYTNTSHVIQQFNKIFEPKCEKTNLDIYCELMEQLGVKSSAGSSEIMSEFTTAIADVKTDKYLLKPTNGPKGAAMFENGCDNLNKRFESFFEQSFQKEKVNVSEFVY